MERNDITKEQQSILDALAKRVEASLPKESEKVNVIQIQQPGRSKEVR
jgi:hypothetical protein